MFLKGRHVHTNFAETGMIMQNSFLGGIHQSRSDDPLKRSIVAYGKIVERESFWRRERMKKNIDQATGW